MHNECCCNKNTKISPRKKISKYTKSEYLTNTVEKLVQYKRRALKIIESTRNTSIKEVYKEKLLLL